jgi:hypothetical protein
VPSPCQRPKIPGGTSAEAEENGAGTDTAGKDGQRKKKIEKGIETHTAILYATDIPIEECRALVQETILANVGDASVSVAVLQVWSNSHTQEPAQHGCTCNSIPAFQD